jgi:hypothetical protein
MLNGGLGRIDARNVRCAINVAQKAATTLPNKY